MEASSLESLTPLISAADQWHEVVLLLPVLVGLEVVLSADNAIALAAIAKGLKSPEQQKQALNLGLIFALIFRVGLILISRWVLGFRPLMAAGATYLLWLCGQYFLNKNSEIEEAQEKLKEPNSLLGVESKLATTAISIALTDLAFSLDSVAAAVAVSDKLWLVITGGVIGVVALRLSSNLFISMLNNYPRLECAGYLAVGLVGMQLLIRVIWPNIEIPQWLLLSLVSLLFIWGFTNRRRLC
jgi:YkoY family integral membrane protein